MFDRNFVKTVCVRTADSGGLFLLYRSAPVAR
jgi:hypothetical protein